MKAKYQKADPYIIHGDLSACDKFDVIDRIHEISVPTLILVGAEDFLTPVKYSKFLNDNIPGSTYGDYSQRRTSGDDGKT